MPIPKKSVLVTGGNGFIGSHLAKRLKEDYNVLVADRSPTSSIEHGCDIVVGNLCDLTFCRHIVRGIDTVFHLAANMGGMGVIHADNDFTIYHENNTMLTHLLSASVEEGVRAFFFASSACVYPESLQNGSTDVSLREQDAYKAGVPAPQGLYGLQKRHVEEMLRNHPAKLDISIARFHNVYGPGGAWDNGREKAPAALLRKAIVLKELNGTEMEIWGDGSQRRSFLYIDDCIRAIVQLWNLPKSGPVILNVGSDRSISIRDLAMDALAVAGFDQPPALKYDPSKPVGVASRNSNNELAYKTLQGWKPEVTMRKGLELMKPWLEDEIEGRTRHLIGKHRRFALEKLLVSNVIKLEDEQLTFAILLPVTTRNSSLDAVIHDVRKFARSLYTTTFQETHDVGATTVFRIKVYVAVDADDKPLVTQPFPIIQALQDEKVYDVVQTVYNVEKGHVCELWRGMALQAYKDGCDYFCLMGDDIVIQDAGWMQHVHEQFQQFEHVPFGIGCVAFTDTTFPGMPTFPVVHRTHMDIFGGIVVPEIFVNQDGDPFLFQLYRRFGCSVMMNKRLENRVGGSEQARYEKKSAEDWTLNTLSSAVSSVQTWLYNQGSRVEPKLVLDVVVPSYRVSLPHLERILALKPSETCSVMFVIIIDNPNNPNTALLESKYGHRPDIRLRTHIQNLGASAARNRGLKESAADWVFFLDDDVEPEPDLLQQAEKVIREHPNVVGFIGTSLFPVADTVSKAAVHLSGVTYFWDIARKTGGEAARDVPWGVTANLIVRRDDKTRFDTRFPKTGGGEDIAFCRDKRKGALEKGLGGFHIAPDVVVTHPWWNNGGRNYQRFFMWAYGDGGLIKMYPEWTYWDYSPNSGELLFLALGLIWVGVAMVPFGYSHVLRFGWNLAKATILVNILHDSYRHLIRDVDRTRGLNTTVTGSRWILAVLESTLVRMSTEVGRVIGQVARGEFGVGRRFDWFTGTMGDGPKMEERKNGFQKFIAIVTLVCILLVNA